MDGRALRDLLSVSRRLTLKKARKHGHAEKGCGVRNE
jgi:hypothetical protein